MRVSLVIGVAAALAGCATTTPQVALTSTFDPAEVAWAMVEGDNTLTGNAVLRTVGGEARTCAGFEAMLIPVSTYATERMLAIYGSTEGGFNNRSIEFDATDPDYIRSQRKTICDSQGNFRFERLPDGEYWVVTRITWGVPGYYITLMQGGYLSQRVALRGGGTKHVVLTRQ